MNATRRLVCAFLWLYCAAGITCFAPSARADILVGDFNEAQVLRFDDTGHLLGVFDSGYTPGPIAVDGQGRIYIKKFDTGEILRYTSNGQFLDVFAQTPAEFGWGMVFDPSGNLYLRQGSNFGSDVFAFDPSGNTLLQFRLPFDGQGSIAVDAHGNLYAPRDELLSHYPFDPDGAIYRYIPDGQTPFGQAVYPLNGFAAPEGTAVDQNGILYVMARGQVFRYDPSGSFLGSFVTGITEGMVLDGLGYIYGVGGESVVYKFDGQGNSLGTIIAAGVDGVPENFRPMGIGFVAAVPEPSTLILAAAGLVILLGYPVRRPRGIRFIR